MTTTAAPDDFPDLPDDIPFDQLLEQAEQQLNSQIRTQQPPAQRSTRTAPLAGAASALDPLAADPALLNAGGTDDILEPPKKRRIIAKLDPDRLLGPNGLPRLLDRARQMRFRGKGHEMDDLERLLRFYRLWAIELFPKLTFSAFIDRAERVCRDKRVRMYMSQLIRDRESKRLGIHAEHYDVDASVDGMGDAVADVAMPSSDGPTPMDAAEMEPTNADAAISNTSQNNQDADDEDAQSVRTPGRARASRLLLDFSDSDEDGGDMLVLPRSIRAQEQDAETSAPADAQTDQANAEGASADPSAAAALSEERLAQIRANKERALAKLAARQAEREAAQREARRAEEERRIAAMIAEAGSLLDEY